MAATDYPRAFAPSRELSVREKAACVVDWLAPVTASACGIAFLLGPIRGCSFGIINDHLKKMAEDPIE